MQERGLDSRLHVPHARCTYCHLLLCLNSSLSQSAADDVYFIESGDESEREETAEAQLTAQDKGDMLRAKVSQSGRGQGRAPTIVCLTLLASFFIPCASPAVCRCV